MLLFKTFLKVDHYVPIKWLTTSVVCLVDTRSDVLMVLTLVCPKAGGGGVRFFERWHSDMCPWHLLRFTQGVLFVSLRGDMVVCGHGTYFGLSREKEGFRVSFFERWQGGMCLWYLLVGSHRRSCSFLWEVTWWYVPMVLTLVCPKAGGGVGFVSLRGDIVICAHGTYFGLPRGSCSFLWEVTWWYVAMVLTLVCPGRRRGFG